MDDIPQRCMVTVPLFSRNCHCSEKCGCIKGRGDSEETTNGRATIRGGSDCFFFYPWLFCSMGVNVAVDLFIFLHKPLLLVCFCPPGVLAADWDKDDGGN